MFKVYGENGITLKIATKIESQQNGYRGFLNTMRLRYAEMSNEVIKADFSANNNGSIFLFPTFGKRGRYGRPQETGFGEPDMIISTRTSNYIFEYETDHFSRLIYQNNDGILKTKGLPYQLCRFYQLGEKLNRLNNETILDPEERCDDARYHFINNAGNRKSQYYFNFRANGDPHSFENAALNLLAKNNFYIVSVTNDNSYEEAMEGLKQMLSIVGEDNYDLSRFIVLTYNDLQNRNCFGDKLQLSLNGARQGFQVINLRRREN